MEEWIEIEDWPDYAISNLGRIKRLTNHGRGRAGTIRKPVMVGGYPAVTFTDATGRRKMINVHRLVAAAFLEPPLESGLQVIHLDDDKANAAAINLQWVSRSDARKRGYATGKCDAKGERNNFAKLTDDDVRLIRSMANNRRTRLDLCARFNVAEATLEDVWARRTWDHIP